MLGQVSLKSIVKAVMTFIERIKSGQKLVGTVATLPCPELIEGLVKCGFDWLWIDLEHAPVSLREAQQMLQRRTAARTGWCACQPAIRSGSDRCSTSELMA